MAFFFFSVAEDFNGLNQYRPSIFPDGTVRYQFPSIVDTLCPLDVQKFPFDTQKCRLIFGSWSFHGNMIDLYPLNSYGDLSSANHNVEWEAVSFEAKRNVMYYACCPEPFPDVTFTLTLRRKPTFFVNNIIIPSMLITFISILGFILPADSGEKVSLQVTVLLALAVFQLLVADLLPPDSDSTPYIGQYDRCILFYLIACFIHINLEKEQIILQEEQGEGSVINRFFEHLSLVVIFCPTD